MLSFEKVPIATHAYLKPDWGIRRPGSIFSQGSLFGYPGRFCLERFGSVSSELEVFPGCSTNVR